MPAFNARLIHATTVPAALTFFRGQIRFMREAGFEVHVLSSPGPVLIEFSKSECVEAHAAEMKRSISPIHDLGALWRIYRELRKTRPDIVHAHTPKAGLLVMIAAFLARTPARIYHIHGLPMITATGVKRILLRLSEKVACALAHKVLCVSKSVQEVAIDENLCDKQKIKVLLQGSINGVDSANRFNPYRFGPHERLNIRTELGIAPNDRVIGYVGRIVRDKGWIELSDAWRLLREEYPDSHLLVIGPFEPQDPVPQDVRMLLQTDPRIHLMGQIADVPRYFTAMDLVVLPSYREGLPCVPLEAAAMQLPVVATKIPGCIDAVVDGVTGTLVHPRDSVSLAQAIGRYLADPELRARHGLAARERIVRDFSPEKIWQAILAEYEEFLEARLKCATPAKSKLPASTQ
jgi:glycosyltransferase involved in cell wall biosynthesis